MPYEWVIGPEMRAAPERSGAASLSAPPPGAELHLWPHRSLPRGGFVLFIAATAGLLMVPLLAVLGTPALWAVLPFVLAVTFAIWMALERSYRSGEIVEILRIWPERAELRRRCPRRADLVWQANPYWVTVSRHPDAGPVPDYLTLRGAGREVEIGAFLSEEERRALEPELRRAFARPA